MNTENSDYLGKFAEKERIRLAMELILQEQFERRMTIFEKAQYRKRLVFKDSV